MRRHLLWLVPLLLLTMWLGLHNLKDSIWHDEAWSVYYAGGAHYGPITLAETWTRAGERFSDNPPGYYLVLNGWGRLVGWSLFASRFLSLLGGLLAVAWVYRLGRDTISPLAGLSAALVLGTSALFVHFLQEMRAFAHIMLFVPMTLWAYWHVITRARPHVLAQVALLMGALGLLYTHYFAALMLVALGLYHVLFGPKGALVARAGLMGIAGLLFLPWFLPTISGGLSTQSADTRLQSLSLPPGAIIERVLYYFGNGIVLLPIIAAAVGVWALLARRARVERRAEWFLWFVTLALLALMLLANMRLNVMNEGRMRYLMALWPLLALLVGGGVAALAQRRIQPGIVLGVWMVIGVASSLNPAFVQRLDGSRPDDIPWDRLLDTVNANRQAGDVFTFHATLFPWAVLPVFDYYRPVLPARATLLESLPDEAADGTFYEQARRFIDGAVRVWVAVDEREPATFRLQALERALSTDYMMCPTPLDTPVIHLDLYALNAVCCAPPSDAASDPRVRFEGGATITFVDLPRTAADTLPVLLAWVVPDSLPDSTYSVALHVEDASGELVAQVDYGLPVESFSCYQADVALTGLPEGEYRLWVILYNWQTGARLMGVDAAGASAERVSLGSFTIETLPQR